jgi:hypothetical protein
MLPIDKTFRVLQTSIPNGSRCPHVAEPEVTSFDRITARPFDNPWYHLLPFPAAGEAVSPADIDLIRAAYFATFPAVD